MAVSQTIKTRAGIKSFILPTTEGDDSAIAFMYLDKKIEVHLLKHECAPLYLEENTSLALVNGEQFGDNLLAVTLTAKQGKGSCLTFRIWDLSSVLGFTPKDVQIEDSDGNFSQDGKFRGQLQLAETITDFSLIKVDSLGSLLALLVEKDVYIWEIHKSDTGVLNFKYMDLIKLKGLQNPGDMVLLQVNGVYSISIGESGYIRTWNFEKPGFSSSQSVSIPNSSNAVVSVQGKLQRLSSSKIIFADDLGKLWIFCLQTNCFTNLKLPGSVHSDGEISFAYSSIEGNCLLAVCYEEHTINLFYHKTEAGANSINSFSRPFKALFSAAPVNSLAFLKPDTLTAASSSNGTLSFWTGLLSG